VLRGEEELQGEVGEELGVLLTFYRVEGAGEGCD
jgi:hypothetical protein